MLTTIKHSEFFDPSEFKEQVHVIGVGAIGSHIAEMLVRLGIETLHLYDFDTVEAANVANQMYREGDIGRQKVDALAQQLLGINQDVKLYLHEAGWDNHAVRGHVFLCVDSIEVRRAIVEANQYNTNIKAMYDFRMRLTDAQHYAADWMDSKQIGNLLETMAFSHEEAKQATPVSACGTTLSVLPTIRVITAMGVANFINQAKGKPIKNMILIDAFVFDTIAV